MRLAHALRVAPLACLLASGVAVGPAAADEVADFYKGKQVTIVLGTGPGRTYDLYARLLARHMQKRIPGRPNMLVQYMEGGGGLTATNHMYNAAPKDGTYIATLFGTLPSEQLTKPNVARYDARNFNWLGAFSSATNVVAVMNDAPATTVEGIKEKEVVIGSIGRGNSTYQFPALINHIVGTKFKLISGYPSGAEIYKAMESGEVHGYAPIWLSLTATKTDWLDSGRIKVLVQGGPVKLARLPNVPLLIEFAKTDEQRRMVLFQSAGSVLAHSALAPPGVPADRLKALEEAFAKTVADPEYLADAAKQKLPISFTSKAKVVESVEQILSTPAALIETMKKVTG